MLSMLVCSAAATSSSASPAASSSASSATVSAEHIASTYTDTMPADEAEPGDSEDETIIYHAAGETAVLDLWVAKTAGADSTVHLCSMLFGPIALEQVTPHLLRRSGGWTKHVAHT